MLNISLFFAFVFLHLSITAFSIFYIKYLKRETDKTTFKRCVLAAIISIFFYCIALWILACVLHLTF